MSTDRPPRSIGATRPWKKPTAWFKGAVIQSLARNFNGADLTYAMNLVENRNQVLASNTNDGIMGTLKMNPKNRADVKENPEKYAFHNM